MLFLLKNWKLALLLLSLLALLGTHAAAYWTGKSDCETSNKIEQLQDNTNATKSREKIDHAVKELADSELDAAMSAAGWMRTRE